MAPPIHTRWDQSLIRLVIGRLTGANYETKRNLTTSDVARATYIVVTQHHPLICILQSGRASSRLLLVDPLDSVRMAIIIIIIIFVVFELKLTSWLTHENELPRESALI